MPLADEQVRVFGAAVGLHIPDEDLGEVTVRLAGVLAELDRLADLDLAGIEAAPLFSEDVP